MTKHCAAGYLEKVERQLKSLNATIRVRKGDSRFDELLTYGRELEVRDEHVRWLRNGLTTTACRISNIDSRLSIVVFSAADCFLLLLYLTWM